MKVSRPRCPLVIALVPLKCSSRNLLIPHVVPCSKEKMPWCHYQNPQRVCPHEEQSLMTQLLIIIKFWEIKSYVFFHNCCTSSHMLPLILGVGSKRMLMHELLGSTLCHLKLLYIQMIGKHLYLFIHCLLFPTAQ